MGQRERITMVTSFRPRNPELPDDSRLTTVRPVSNLSELYRQFADYRLKMLQERIETQLQQLQTIHESGKRTDIKQLKTFLKVQAQFLAHMDKEIVEEENVEQGKIDSTTITSSPPPSKASSERRITKRSLSNLHEEEPGELTTRKRLKRGELSQNTP